jgi:hypothetical protein
MAGIVRLRAGERAPESVRRAVQRQRDRVRFGLSDAAMLHYDELKAAITIPGSKFDYSQATALRLSLRTKLQRAVATVMNQAPVIRDLAPYDVSGVAAGNALYARLTNKQALVANTWLVNDLGFRAVPINTAVGIYGFIQLQAVPNIDAIAFTQGGVVTLAQFWLDVIYADQFSSIGYFDPPVVWAPQQQIGINLLASSAVSAAVESYGLLGYIAEPAAATVAPDQTQLS